MPWQPVLTSVVRTLINDVDEDNQQFSDERIQNTILVAAQLTQMHLDFAQVYNISVDTDTISPDPVDLQDSAFVNLVALRTNLIFADSQYRTMALKAGLRVKDGDTSIDTTKTLAGYGVILQNAQNAYDSAKDEYLAGNMTPGQAILSPMSSPTLNFSGFSFSPRDRSWYSRGVV